MKGFTTRAIHARYLKKDVHGALRMPVYDNAAFEHDSAYEISMAFEGKRAAHMYSRITNPTVEDFEQKVKSVSNGNGVLALSSGMAAISNLIFTIACSGDNILTTKNLFGNTYSLFEKTLKPWGLETRYLDFNKYDDIESYIDERTKIIFFESLSNPQLEVIDIEKISNICKRKNILLVVDTTLTPPFLLSSKELGIDVEIISSTKYISGGGTSIGGLIIDYGTYNWSLNEKLKEDYKKFGPMTLIMKLKREVFRNLGACLSPHNAYLQSLGLETLALRAKKSCDNSLQLAGFLESNDKIVSVNYPGLKSSPFYDIAKKQFPNGAGALLTFRLRDRERCFNLIDNLEIIRKSTNLNDNKTLILHPSSTIYCEYSHNEQREMSVYDDMIRLAVGIEDVEDLIDDFKQTLKLV